MHFALGLLDKLKSRANDEMTNEAMTISQPPQQIQHLLLGHCLWSHWFH